VAIFVYGFIGQTAYVSLTDWGQEAALSITPEINFIGLDNYRQLFGNFVNTRFRQDIVNTFTYMVLIIGGALLIGLVTAILLDREPKGRSGYRTIFLYPMALSFVVTGTIWRWLFAPQGGINLIPTWFGGERGEFRWLSSRVQILQFNWQNVAHILGVIVAILFLIAAIRAKNADNRGRMWVTGVLGALFFLCGVLGWPQVQALPYEESHGVNLATFGVIIAAVWQYSGYTMALFLAGLQGIPVTLHDSAKITGANEFQYYWHIAIPLLKTTALSAIIILSHVSLKIFALIFAMAGPDNAQTGHPAVLMYLETFRANNMAKGAAISIVLFLIAALFIIPYLVYSHRERRA
jgi:glucose/mannose transport system permease protein